MSFYPAHWIAASLFVCSLLVVLATLAMSANDIALQDVRVESGNVTSPLLDGGTSGPERRSTKSSGGTPRSACR